MMETPYQVLSSPGTIHDMSMIFALCKELYNLSWDYSMSSYRGERGGTAITIISHKCVGEIEKHMHYHM